MRGGPRLPGSFSQGRLAVVLLGKCELGVAPAAGVLPAPLHPLLIHASTHPSPPSPAVSWAPRAGLMQRNPKMRNWPGLPCPWDSRQSTLLQSVLIRPCERAPSGPLKPGAPHSESCTQRARAQL